ncbi:hypothetical protein T08_3454 [Trichinella sp. T8]|nr:hypothetical protein T08_3454 [Trichinella sp. T8]
MYNGNYSEHLRNYGVLQNNFLFITSNFVPIKGLSIWNFLKKKTGILHDYRFQI